MNLDIEPLEPRYLMAALPTGFSETTLAAGLAGPTAAAFAPDGRLFVAEQTGNLRIIKNGQLLSPPILSLKVDSAGERGLLGIAFDPAFSSNHNYYVYYTVPGRKGAGVHNRVSRFTAAGDLTIKRSERILLEIDPLSSASNHNGGALAFGPDGKLYIATGENARPPLAQDVTSQLGKILRLNPDGTVPTDNPFYNKPGAAKTVWALGLRNPFNFSFDPGTGKMLINDVGQHTYEEINQGAAGANYGWPDTEGPTQRAKFKSPVFYYAHGDGPTTGGAIVGSAFYSPAARTFPKNYAGDYFFADLTSGWIRRRDNATGDVAGFASGVSFPVALAVHSDGSLWYVARGTGDETGVVMRVDFG